MVPENFTCEATSPQLNEVEIKRVNELLSDSEWKDASAIERKLAANMIPLFCWIDTNGINEMGSAGNLIWINNSKIYTCENTSVKFALRDIVMDKLQK